MSVTDEDWEKARELRSEWMTFRGADGYLSMCMKEESDHVEAIAAALAAEREKARAPFRALADELDMHSGELWRAYKSADPADFRRANPRTEAMSDAYEDAAESIRRALDVAEEPRPDSSRPGPPESSDD